MSIAECVPETNFDENERFQSFEKGLSRIIPTRKPNALKDTENAY